MVLINLSIRKKNCIKPLNHYQHLKIVGPDLSWPPPIYWQSGTPPRMFAAQRCLYLQASGVTNIIPYTLSSLPAFHSGYNVSNVITTIARGSNFYFYVNQQFLVSATDSSLTCGKVGFYAFDWTGPSSASFSNVKVWKL